ncbi:SDR family NAD(P)-dependent oxidoreductase [Chitinophaga ginsengisoli]|uniref:3-oxoacyl-[acyl-carrier protein] reductase n=1 Tax=Chitinophaga ginsengisoli TaxID=363837 RepID=A0A2P8FGM0_9BACT|nr:3-oxoacyl-ACP reductase family protein [Chitinophaga ginsengisoli]PSL20872.1 3-oxoacyl-[acyl-carrier protein] reductase [Chitinophaga ginsengisoli]
MKHLENKVALVTGGSRGMGAAIVKQLAEAGANVAFTYVRSAAKAHQLAADISKTTGQTILALAADNASDTAVTAAVEEVAGKLGGIDILVNNAGIYEKKPLEEQTAADYDEMMDVNVKAVFMASITAIKHMKAGGRIISIGSNMADRVAGPGATLYAMSKSALKGLTKGLARELGPKGITVNLVQPGPTDTDMNPATSAHADKLRSMMALPHYGNVSDIASLVSFLAGPQSGFITGASLTIDGGFNI